jgi:hypothetical protein
MLGHPGDRFRFGALPFVPELRRVRHCGFRPLDALLALIGLAAEAYLALRYPVLVVALVERPAVGAVLATALVVLTRACGASPGGQSSDPALGWASAPSFRFLDGSFPDRDTTRGPQSGRGWRRTP